jgi:hypothetical protein
MRRIGIVLSTFVIGLVTVGLVTGQQEQQQPKKKFGGGFGFGGFGGKGGTAISTLTLLNNEQVQKELEVTPEQLEKVPDAVQKALAEVLNEKQAKRLRQIDLQVRGVNAFNDSKVQSQLKITDEQKENIKTIITESGKERQEIFKEAQGGNFEGMQEKMTALTKETQEKVQGVLTADQRKQWRQMIGDEFKLENPGFGGFGGGKGFGKKKKKDA